MVGTTDGTPGPRGSTFRAKWLDTTVTTDSRLPISTTWSDNQWQVFKRLKSTYEIILLKIYIFLGHEITEKQVNIYYKLHLTSVVYLACNLTGTFWSFPFQAAGTKVGGRWVSAPLSTVLRCAVGVPCGWCRGPCWLWSMDKLQEKVYPQSLSGKTSHVCYSAGWAVHVGQKHA